MKGSQVKSDSSAVSAADLALHKVESALNFTSGVVIFALVCLAATNVLARKLLNLPIPGFVDWVEQLMAIFAFIGIAYCQREGGHIRMDILIGRLRRRVLWFVELLSVLVILLLVTVLIYGSWAHFLRSFDFGSPYWSRDSSIDISLPLWPAKLIVPIALTLLWLRVLLQIWAYWRAFRLGSDEVFGAPTIPDALTQAAQEASGLEGKGRG